MAYKYPHTFMKTITTLSFTLLAIAGLCITSCSKDDGEDISNPYSSEQLKTLKVLHGTFVSEPDAIGATTEFSFYETYLDKPRVATGTNVYGEKSEYTIHGYCSHKYNYGSVADYNIKSAFYISTNGVDMKLYSAYDDKSISRNSAPDNYKIVVMNDNQIKLTDINYPLNGSVYTRK